MSNCHPSETETLLLDTYIRNCNKMFKKYKKMRQDRAQREDVKCNMSVDKYFKSYLEWYFIKEVPANLSCNRHIFQKNTFLMSKEKNK